MSSKLWWAGALAAAIGAGGCAHKTKVEEAKLGQLPIGEKSAIFAAQHNITVAEANEASSKSALKQATQFRDIAKTELSAAKKREEVALRALDLGRKTHSPVAIRTAESDEAIASRELTAARAKVAYADRVVDLRGQELNLARDQLSASKADLDYTQAEALRRNGINPDVNMADVVAARDQQRSKVANDERRVASLRDETNGARLAWEQQQRSFNVAEREQPNVPPVTAPKAPKKIKPAPVPGLQLPSSEGEPPSGEQQSPSGQRGKM